MLGRRRLIRRLRQLGAVTLDSARPLDGLSAGERRALARLRRIGIAREREPGSFHLDETAWWRHRLRIRKTVLILMSAALTGAALIASLLRT